MIVFSHVTKRYGASAAVQDLSFTIPDGQVVGLLGQNGAGKTTTLNMLVVTPAHGPSTVPMTALHGPLSTQLKLTPFFRTLTSLPSPSLSMLPLNTLTTSSKSLTLLAAA